MLLTFGILQHTRGKEPSAHRFTIHVLVVEYAEDKTSVEIS